MIVAIELIQSTRLLRGNIAYIDFIRLEADPSLLERLDVIPMCNLYKVSSDRTATRYSIVSVEMMCTLVETSYILRIPPFNIHSTEVQTKKMQGGDHFNAVHSLHNYEAGHRSIDAEGNIIERNTLQHQFLHQNQSPPLIYTESAFAVILTPNCDVIKGFLAFVCLIVTASAPFVLSIRLRSLLLWLLQGALQRYEELCKGLEGLSV